jgi:predicted DNA-binding WGR domain protein
MAGMRARLTEPNDPGVVRFVRLECHEGGSNKFYTALVERDPDASGAFRCRCEWGRVGGAVSTQTKATGDQATCERALDGIAREKQRKGYGMVLDERRASRGEAGVEPAATVAASGDDSLSDLLERRRREATWAL